MRDDLIQWSKLEGTHVRIHPSGYLNLCEYIYCQRLAPFPLLDLEDIHTVWKIEKNGSKGYLKSDNPILGIVLVYLSQMSSEEGGSLSVSM